MTDLTLQCRWRRGGGVTETELSALADPEAWTADEAREVAWAIQRALRAHALYSMAIIEVESMKVWSIRVVTDTGTATTRGLHLSLEAMTWFERAAFMMPGLDVH